MKNIYQTKVLFRGYLKHISKLSDGSKFKIKINCPDCGVDFFRHFNILANSGNFLCQKCTLKYQKAKNIDINQKFNMLTVIGISKTGFSDCICDCGNKVTVENYNLKNNNTKSCGCLKKQTLVNYRKLNPQALKGVNHPNWKGGITCENQTLRVSQAYKDWRLAVFTRDNFECKKCFKKGGELNAHHILEFANNKDIISDVNNGITFCNKCHSEFHRIYGRKNLSKKMIIEYIKT